jgi:hypothetical protein
VDGTQPPFARAWLAQWSAASSALERVHDDELRALTDAEALRRIDALLSLPSPWVDPARRSSSGLVEQQRLFERATRRGP